MNARKPLNLMDQLANAKVNLFRFEALQEYNTGEIDNIEEWRTTKKLNEELFKDWWDFLETKHCEGVTTQRVRRIVYPLTTYTRWELDVHALTSRHGDEIRVITEDQFLPLRIPPEDFWLIDDSVALRMRYTDDGHFLGFDLEHNAQKYIQYKQNLLNNSSELPQEGHSRAMGEMDDYKRS